MRRTSPTVPTFRPSASTTRAAMSSLSCMAAAGESVDDVVADPAFGGVAGELVAVRGERDVAGDRLDPSEGDAGRIAPVVVVSAASGGAVGVGAVGAVVGPQLLGAAPPGAEAG